MREDILGRSKLKSKSLVAIFFCTFVYSFNDIVNISEISLHISIIKYFYWFFLIAFLQKIIGAISGLPHGPYTVKNLKPVQGIS